MVGDLALLARDLRGHVVAHRSGHQLNAELVRKLIDAVEAGRPDGRRGRELPIEAATIMKILPHRFPFLLVDRVLEHEPGRRVLALKNVSCNEPFFQGHWPGRPIMPGVLILEALAQAAGIMIADTIDVAAKVALIVAIDQVKIRKTVVPGDQLRLEVVGQRLKSSSAEVYGVARVDDQLAAEAKIRFVILDADRAC